MIIELRKKAQVTIPKDVILNLGLKEGDKLDIIEKDGVICIMPVAIYSKKYIEELKTEILEVKKSIKEGSKPEFDNIEALFEHLES